MPPPAVSEIELVKRELRVLEASGQFDRTKNLWLLLEYVCNKYFQGQTDQLKEFSIAVDVFGRGTEFDKKRDSIVRVEAHRLRKRLHEYYESEGADHPVQIVIPPGQYSPTFVVRDEALTAAGAAGSPGRRQRLVAVAALALLAISITLAYWYSQNQTDRQASAAGPANSGARLVAAAPGDTVRISAGSHGGQQLDSMGHTWSADAYFTEGDEASAPFRTVLRTKDTSMYLRRREGNFRYDIPLKPGSYEMRLFFAETMYGESNIEGGGEASRLFRVLVNGKTVLDWFDLLADAAAPNTADVKVFKQISPAPDGFLHLQFVSQKDRAFVNAIEIVPSDAHRLKPIRLVARDSGYTDNRGNMWLPEMYVSGGRLTLRQQEVSGAGDTGIYQGERYGNFSYAIPVPAGKYTVVLHFAETWFGPDRPGGGGAGSRVFSVYCNGIALLKSFDIFKEAEGSFKPVEKRFTGIQANAQGKLMLSFVPDRNYACVNAIEVFDEGDSTQI